MVRASARLPLCFLDKIGSRLVRMANIQFRHAFGVLLEHTGTVMARHTTLELQDSFKLIFFGIQLHVICRLCEVFMAKFTLGTL